MIVWISSFPRSGNTFLRIVLHRLFGVHTSVIYDHDGVAERLGTATVGFEERPSSIDDMRASKQIHFVKTHKQRSCDRVAPEDRVIFLARDGRDALVSWARLRCESDPAQFETELRALIERPSSAAGTWGSNVLSWRQSSSLGDVLLRYEDVIAAPVAAVTHAMSLVSPEHQARHGAELPSFAELQALDPLFFRKGRVGAHRDELSDELHALFWSKQDNADAMALLGYIR